MATMRDRWTDERLDDLNQHVSYGFNRIDADLQGIRSEMSGLRSEMGGLRDEVRGEMNDLRTEVNSRFDSLQKTMLQSAMLIVAALIGLIATQL
jgi:hypothetical protein